MSLRNLLAALGMLVTTSALATPASPKGPVGMGNFRRADAIKAVGATSRGTRVVGATTAAHHNTGMKLPGNARVLFVDHPTASGRQVDLVKAPLNHAKPVQRLTAKEGKAMSILTQDQAQHYTVRNDGVMGTLGPVKTQKAGLSASGGSYAFKQTSPATVTVNRWKTTYKVTNITRTVPSSGPRGESASGTFRSVTPHVPKINE